MRAFWPRDDQFEQRLRASRPRPSEELVRRIARRAEPPRRIGALALAFAASLTVAMVAALASVGGIGYAASAVADAAQVVKRAITPEATAVPKKVLRISAGGDQYRPGFGFGDPNHTHTGPPGLERREDAPEPRPRRIANRTFVRTSVVLDEQAVLWISVFGPGGRQAVISQDGTLIGGGTLTGPPTKAIKYVVLVPRVIRIQLAVLLGPRNAPGEYTVRIFARDPDGETAIERVEFEVPTDWRITGTVRNDRVAGGRGNDVITTGAGNDRISAGGGDDWVHGRAGNDLLVGGWGNDQLRGGPGNDRIFGGPGEDLLSGGPGNDFLHAADKSGDVVNCGGGRDTAVVDQFDLVAACERVIRR